MCPYYCFTLTEFFENWQSFRQRNYKLQECIPVGYVPAARRPYAGVCFLGGGGLPGPGGVCLVWGGVFLGQGGVCLVWGVSSWPRGSAWSQGGVCLVPGGFAWSRGVCLVPGGSAWAWGGCLPGPGGRVCLVWGEVWHPSMH